MRVVDQYYFWASIEWRVISVLRAANPNLGLLTLKFDRVTQLFLDVDMREIENSDMRIRISGTTFYIP